MEEIQKTEIHYVEKNSSIYPARLRELSGMPKQLYYIGRFPEDNKPTAAIVGARLCSAYGRIQAFRYGKFLSEHGVQVQRAGKPRRFHQRCDPPAGGSIAETFG